MSTVDVTATTLYEAAVLAVAEFRRIGLFDVPFAPERGSGCYSFPLTPYGD
jgi:hypothetical protein